MDQSLLQLKNAGVISEEVYQTRVTPKLGAAPYGN